MKHIIEVVPVGNGYTWVCSCGVQIPYCYANLERVNRHERTCESVADPNEETWAQKSEREKNFTR